MGWSEHRLVKRGKEAREQEGKKGLKEGGVQMKE